MPQITLTKHVIRRAKERAVNLKDIHKTIRFPDKVTQSKTSNSKKHLKNFDLYRLTVVIKRQAGAWIAVSVWKKPLPLLDRKQATQAVNRQCLLERVINNLLIKLEKTFNRRS